MNAFSAFVVYVMVWWTVLFMVLPFGIRNQREAGEVAWGSEPGAPERSRMLSRLGVTTLIATVVWALLFAVLALGGFTLDSIPFLPDPGRPLSS